MDMKKLGMKSYAYLLIFFSSIYLILKLIQRDLFGMSLALIAIVLGVLFLLHKRIFGHEYEL